ncbi:hypothetical protein TNCV_3747571 [Trichonephila clavipes]|nr:hypothetical protein TNCV_3747571 [Trichonephila clavipes]
MGGNTSIPHHLFHRTPNYTSPLPINITGTSSRKEVPVPQTVVQGRVDPSRRAPHVGGENKEWPQAACSSDN